MDDRGQILDIDKSIVILKERISLINSKINILLEERYAIEEDLAELYRQKNKDGQ